MIRKRGKAAWEYECRPCGHEATAPDQLRILEARNRHERTPAHALNGIRGVFQTVFDAYAEAARVIIDTVTPAMESFSKAFEAPRNLPHDPSLLKDRRKWGGR